MRSIFLEFYLAVFIAWMQVELVGGDLVIAGLGFC